MKYISMLRGINVSGQKTIRMDDLRAQYVRLGFADVVTYIQSGNVIFESAEKNRAVLKTKIEKAIEKKYGFQVPVEIRSHRDFANILDHCPFAQTDVDDYGTKILVTFLSASPTKANTEKLLQSVDAPEQLVVIGKEIYLFCPNGHGKSKLSNTFLENKLGIGATTRNWKTVHKLYELSCA